MKISYWSKRQSAHMLPKYGSGEGECSWYNTPWRLVRGGIGSNLSDLQLVLWGTNRAILTSVVLYMSNVFICRQKIEVITATFQLPMLIIMKHVLIYCFEVYV